jgi:hypothetical protein
MRKLTLVTLLALPAQLCMAQMSLTVQWDKAVMISKSTATLQVVGNPQLRRGASMHDGSFNSNSDFNKKSLTEYIIELNVE